MKIAIVNKETLQIVLIYEDSAPNQGRFGGPWGSAESHAHLSAEGLDEDCLKAVLVEGHVQLQLDEAKASAKIQAARNARLAILRDKRDEKMKEVDVMVNELALGEREDQQAVKDYRNALKDVTTPYKYALDPDRAKAAIDNIDLEEFDWPVKPE